MIVVVFRARRTPEGEGENYRQWFLRMSELACKMPGYISHKGFFAEDGERVTIVEFESEEAQRVWRMHPEHRVAQRQAKEIYYESHSVQVCQVIRENRFKREAAPLKTP